MSMYSKETYAAMLDQMLTQELMFISTYASEHNIRSAMKRVLGCLIKKGIFKSYSRLVLDENLNVHITFTDVDNSTFDITLYYGQ